jgi:2-phosphosulfolactate phosphatase
MEINIYQLVEGAQQAQGLAVIIDVFRAFSLEPYMFAMGASAVLPVATLEDAYRLKEKHPSYMLVGERNEKKPEGFDFGNSPSHAKRFDLRGKTIVHTTSAGTKGIASATGASKVITASFVNAQAVTRYIRASGYDKISLCCMGHSAKLPGEEDTLCAEYIKAKLLGQSPDFSQIKSTLREIADYRFFTPARQAFAPMEDFEMCMELSIFDFVLEVKKHPGYFEAVKIDI